jgi:hypothetical protein
MADIVKVPFNGDIVRAGQLNGVTHAICKDVCENLGISWGSQSATIGNDEFYRGKLVSIEVETEAGRRQALVLPIKYARLWIAGIGTNAVGEHVKPRLLEYKEKCCDAIEAYFSGTQETKPLSWQDVMRVMATGMLELDAKVMDLGKKTEVISSYIEEQKAEREYIRKARVGREVLRDAGYSWSFVNETANLKALGLAYRKEYMLKYEEQPRKVQKPNSPYETMVIEDEPLYVTLADKFFPDAAEKAKHGRKASIVRMMS